MCLDLLEKREPFSNGRLSSVLIRAAMGSVKTLLPTEGVERKQKLFAFLLDLCFTRTNVKSLYSYILIPTMHYLTV